MKYLTKIVMIAVLALGLTLAATPAQARPEMLHFDLVVVEDPETLEEDFLGTVRGAGEYRFAGDCNPEILEQIESDDGSTLTFKVKADLSDLGYGVVNASIMITDQGIPADQETSGPRVFPITGSWYGLHSGSAQGILTIPQGASGMVGSTVISTLVGN